MVIHGPQHVPGLVLVPAFVSQDEERELVEWFGLDVEPLPTPGSRKHDYHARCRVARYGPGLADSHYISGECHDVMPPILERLASRLVELGRVPADEKPNAITVNEYRTGQGIALHTDVPRAGLIVSTLGLWGDATLRMQRRLRGSPKIDLPFRRRDLYQFTGECRVRPWEHAILPVKEHRLSVVFRCGKALP